MLSFPVNSRLATTFVVAIFVWGVIPPRAAMADSALPESVKALLPAGSTPGEGSWETFETEFGTTFGGGLAVTEFPGKKPSCAFGLTTEFSFDLQGDSAFDEPPMLDMALQQFQTDIENSHAGMSQFVTDYVKPLPDIVSVGTVQKEKLAGGEVIYVDMVENCDSHPNGAKTMMRGSINRGATRLSFQLVASQDAATAKAVAAEIFKNFEALDIKALIP